MTHADYTTLIRAFGLLLVALAILVSIVWAIIGWFKRTRPVKRKPLVPFQPYDPRRHHIRVDTYGESYGSWRQRNMGLESLCGNISGCYTRVDSPVPDPALLIEQLSSKGLKDGDRDPLCLKCATLLLETEGQAIDPRVEVSDGKTQA
jgi:hypothetical protein